jgi:hypothetical protein
MIGPDASGGATGDQAEAAGAFMRRALGSDIDAAAGASGRAVYQPSDAEARRAEARASAPTVFLPGFKDRVPSDFAADLGRVLASAPLYRREDIVVTIDEKGMLKLMTPERFITWVDDYAVVKEKYAVGSGENYEEKERKKAMQPSLAKVVLQSDAFARWVRPLASVYQVRMPVMRRSGKIELLPEGYDAESRVFTLSSGVGFDEAMEIAKAVALLRSFYGGFPWADGDPETGRSRSMAVAVCLAVSLFGIGLQSVAAARMGYMVLANVQGSGKSLAAQIGICASFGLPKNTPRSGEDELRKVLDTAAIQGASYLFFDNLKNYVESPLLEAFMTSPIWSGRVMGSQRSFEAEKNTVLILTGNNLSVSPDLQRRLLQCDLFVRAADIQERTHERILTPEVVSQPEERGKLLSALWSMVRHWDAQGRPGAGAEPFKKPQLVASFEEWSRIFGGIVQAAGFGNPLEKPKAGKEADVKGMHQRKLVSELSRSLSPRAPLLEYKSQEVTDCIVENELFPWMVKGRTRKDEGSGEDIFVLDSASQSNLGLMLTKEMSGREFFTDRGALVLFENNGESGRGKRYKVTLLASPEALEAQACSSEDVGP